MASDYRMQEIGLDAIERFIVSIAAQSAGLTPMESDQMLSVHMQENIDNTADGYGSHLGTKTKDFNTWETQIVPADTGHLGAIASNIVRPGGSTYNRHLTTLNNTRQTYGLPPY